MNPSVALINAMPAKALALIELTSDGRRREWSFGEIEDACARAAQRMIELGVEREDAVLTVLGNRPEWVITMLAAWRIGAVAVPCNEMLRTKDLSHRIEATNPKLIVAGERNLTELEGATRGRTVLVADSEQFSADTRADEASLSPTDPAVVIFTSGTSSEPKGIVHGQRWLTGQSLQAKEWFAAQPGTLAWCTAAPGWSKSARNVFVAPWMCGAAALLHDGRFDPEERLAIVEREQVATLCQAPTEYRVIAKRTTLRRLPHVKSMVAAGEALDAGVIGAFEEATGVRIRDGYGQTETNHLTAVRPGDKAPAGSMGRALTGVALTIDEGELVVDPSTVETFFVGTLDGRPSPVERPWRTGDLVREEDGWFFFEGRADDIISSSGYRIGPLEVESAIDSHPAVAESGVVGEPDQERGEVVRAVIVLKEGFAPSSALAAEIQDHVKAQTAPYKYPRLVEFSEQLPRTTSGKLRRAELRRPGG